MAEGTNFTLASPTFKHEGEIPRAHTCDGSDLSPRLEWANPPSGTRAFALVVDDPDAPRGVFTHWLVYDIPGDLHELQEGIPDRNALPQGAREGMNDFGRPGYGGPCPPPGPAHRYRFTLYALDRPTDLPERASKAQLLDAVKGRTLAQTTLVGTYARAAKERRA